MSYRYPGSLNRSRYGGGIVARYGIGLILAAVVLLGGCGLLVHDYAQKETVTFTVEDKESVAKSEGGHEYRVYTDNGTYRVTDSWVHPRFDAADVYGRLDEDVRYECDVYGWRIGLFSQFKNILSCDEVAPAQP